MTSDRDYMWLRLWLDRCHNRPPIPGRDRFSDPIRLCRIDDMGSGGTEAMMAVPTVYEMATFQMPSLSEGWRRIGIGDLILCGIPSSTVGIIVNDRLKQTYKRLGWKRLHMSASGLGVMELDHASMALYG